MNEILDSATIKIDFKMRGNHLAQVTLNWNNEFEVRYCRLTLRGDGSVWFQPPALQNFGWAKCFAVIDHDNWVYLEKKVIDLFMEELKRQVDEKTMPLDILEKIKGYVPKEEVTITDEQYEEIDKHSNIHTDL